MGNWLVCLLGLVLVALGGLWTLQGVGLLQIEPIACIADCDAMTGPDLTWSLVGVVTLGVGAGLSIFAVHRLRARPNQPRR